MQNKDELIRRANIGKRVGELLGTSSVQDAYTQTLDMWQSMLGTCDWRDHAGTVFIRGMMDGVKAFWAALDGLRALGEDAERELSGNAPDGDSQSGRMIQ